MANDLSTPIVSLSTLKTRFKLNHLGESPQQWFLTRSSLFFCETGFMVGINSLFLKFSLIFEFAPHLDLLYWFFFLLRGMEDDDDPEYKLLQENGYMLKWSDQPFYSVFYWIPNICLAVTYSYTWMPDTFDSPHLLIRVVSTRAILWDLPVIKNLLSDKSKKQWAS